jgi:hypothetical protein
VDGEVGRFAASLNIGADKLAKLIPSMNLKNSAVVDYRLKLGNQKIYTFARGDLSRRFAEHCVQSLEQAVNDGDNCHFYPD